MIFDISFIRSKISNKALYVEEGVGAASTERSQEDPVATVAAPWTLRARTFSTHSYCGFFLDHFLKLFVDHHLFSDLKNSK